MHVQAPGRGWRSIARYNVPHLYPTLGWVRVGYRWGTFFEKSQQSDERSESERTLTETSNYSLLFKPSSLKVSLIIDFSLQQMIE